MRHRERIIAQSASEKTQQTIKQRGGVFGNFEGSQLGLTDYTKLSGKKQPPRYGTFKPNNPMKLGYVKSIDQRVPQYQEECTFVNELQLKKTLQ